MEFQNGDKVEITIRGTIREKTGSAHWYTHRIEDDHRQNHFVYLALAENNGSLTVTRVISDWPPRPGDIWESDGKEYAALGEHNITLHAIDAVVVYEADEFREFPGLRLVRRRESS